MKEVPVRSQRGDISPRSFLLLLQTDIWVGFVELMGVKEVTPPRTNGAQFLSWPERAAVLLTVWPIELSIVLSRWRLAKSLGGDATSDMLKRATSLQETGSCRAEHIYSRFNVFRFLVNDLDWELFGSLLLLLPTESMSSMVSANSGMVCSVESTVLASAARNLLGETASCGGGPSGISGPCQDRLSSSSRGLVQPVVSASSDTLSGHVVYSSWGRRTRRESWIQEKQNYAEKIKYKISHHQKG